MSYVCKRPLVVRSLVFDGNAYALDFNGTDESLSMGTSAFAYDADDAQSYGVWVRPADGCDGAIISRWDTTGDQCGIVVTLDEDYVTFSMQATDGDQLVVRADASPFWSGGWEHFGVTYDGSGSADGVTMYHNGEAVETTAVLDELDGESTIIATPAAFEVGHTEADDSFFKGGLDELGIWASERTQEQIEAAYGERNPTDLRTLGVIAGYFRMGDGDTLPSVADWSGHGITATASNMDAGNVITGVPAYFMASEILTPAPAAAILPGNDVELTGTITEPTHVSSVKVYYNSGSHEVDSFNPSTGAVEDSFEAVEGVNDIRLEATYDDDSTASDTVTIDTTQAAFTVTIPLDDWEELQGYTIDVDGTVTHEEELTSFTRTYTDVQNITPSSGAWSKDVVATPGYEDIEVNAEWSNGHTQQIIRSGTVIVS